VTDTDTPLTVVITLAHYPYSLAARHVSTDEGQVAEVGHGAGSGRGVAWRSLTVTLGGKALLGITLLLGGGLRGVWGKVRQVSGMVKKQSERIGLTLLEGKLAIHRDALGVG